LLQVSAISPFRTAKVDDFSSGRLEFSKHGAQLPQNKIASRGALAQRNAAFIRLGVFNLNLKVLVTGGAGFIGSRLAAALAARGCVVRVLDIRRPLDRLASVEYREGDLRSPEAVLNATRGVDVVFHLGAVADVREVEANPAWAEEVNCGGTVNVLESAREVAVSRVVFASTTWVYSGVADSFVDESTILPSPEHPYAVTKLTAEGHCAFYARAYELPVTVLRYGSVVYGPGARAGTVLCNFLEQAFEGKPLTVHGDGGQYRKVVYIDDLIEGNILALQSNLPYRVFNLDGSVKITIREMAEKIVVAVGGTIVSEPQRTRDFRGKDVSTERAKAEIGWETVTPFDEGLACTIRWMRERRAAAALGGEPT